MQIKLNLCLSLESQSCISLPPGSPFYVIIAHQGMLHQLFIFFLFQNAFSDVPCIRIIASMQKEQNKRMKRKQILCLLNFILPPIRHLLVVKR